MQVRNDIQELRLLFEVCRTLEGSPELAGRLDAVLERMARQTGMLRGAVCLAEEGGLRLEAAIGFEEGGSAAGMSTDIAAAVLESEDAVCVLHGEKKPVALGRGGLAPEKERIAFFCVPIRLEHEGIGTLSADRLFADSVPLEEDVRLLSIVAGLIAQTAATRRRIQEDILEENRRLQEALRASRSRLIGDDPVFRAVLAQVAQAAASNATVLIRGESGTGKELIAEALHLASPRSREPFVSVNCAALPESLVESELFGHEKGAFTGATALRKGRFELAHRGTLFLDEVGDVSQTVQVKLLRVIQEKRFERVGGTETRQVDVRLVAATSRDLERMLEEKAFRQDLYYRLNVFPVHMPPLRERRGDIVPLARHFAARYSAEMSKPAPRVLPDAEAALLAHDWPGNIRELQNAIERAVILSHDGRIYADLLPANLLPRATSIPPKETGVVPRGESLPELLKRTERTLIEHALREHEGNMGKAAAALGVSERVMGLRMREYGFDFRDFRRK